MSSPSHPHPLRVVDKWVDHGAPRPFRDALQEVISPQTRYVVFDLDRTMHLGHNMGELLGWELCAHQAYGREGVARLEAGRKGRFALDWAHPLKLAHYLSIGARVWAYPGLYYLLWGKMADRHRWLGRRAFRRFGPEPMRTVQRVPQLALMSHLESASQDVLRQLALQVWQRYAPDQVVHAFDIQWIRERAPDAKIIISSASPQPTVEVAAELLGADAAIFSTLTAINSGTAKLERLLHRYEDMASAEVVGITDTGYGEDHCWSHHFTRVVDLNSDRPFGALVPAASPVQEVHSVRALTAEETARRAAGEAGYVDPRRDALGFGVRRELSCQQLQDELQDFAQQLEQVPRDVAPWQRACMVQQIEIRARQHLDAREFKAV